MTEFKVGDTVLVIGGYEEVFSKITGITPSGLIKVQWGNKNLLFYPDGTQRGSGYYNKRIKIPNDAYIERVRRKKLISELQNCNFKKLTLNQLERITAIVEEDA
jgi:hypothetical protein